MAATAVFSAILFDVRLTGVMAAGIALVVIGVLTVELGSHETSRAVAESAADPPG